MDLRRKIVILGVVQLAVFAGVLLTMYSHESKKQMRQQYVEKARGIVLTAESTRVEIGKMWDAGILTAEQLREWAEQGRIDKVVATVPVATAWKAAMRKAKEGQYEFRVPKFEPRSPKNEPDEVEARVLRALKTNKLAEYHEVDESMNAIRYFRPIRLTQECMLCHGDPATSAQLWGNDEGLDPTGARMENWKVGEIHGAFEVIQYLDSADAQIAAAIQKAMTIIGGLALVGAVVFFFAANSGINSLYRPIRVIARTLKEGANEVSDASRQVSGASQRLAEGSSSQASSLEETSAALEEMAAMTRTSADNAKRANELSNRARATAQDGDHTMEELKVAMSAINESSTEISKIIRVIEEIAFQTNLLALNAAVEAARAGEHGKGFAVVADEVRNLAQRAAQASGEITGLIEGSVNRVRQGTSVAGDVGKALGTIVADVTKVADLVNAITEATEEQAQGVDQVNTAVSHLDKVTQQNAAGAEESASAAEELAAQAANVKGMVNDLVALVGGGRNDENSESTGGPPSGASADKRFSGRAVHAKTTRSNRPAPKRAVAMTTSGKDAADNDFMPLEDDAVLKNF